ncbi:hypothetical protein V2J09_012493, partial [Rumex salicifolius]
QIQVVRSELSVRVLFVFSAPTFPIVKQLNLRIRHQVFFINFSFGSSLFQSLFRPLSNLAVPRTTRRFRFAFRTRIRVDPGTTGRIRIVDMSRLSFRPRPLDIHKKLPILKSVKDFEDDDTPTSTRNSQILRLAAEAEIEVHHAPTKKTASDIPTPEFVYVDTYERDYSRTFGQPSSYIRARGARSEIGEFVEYDLDNEDEDWLEQINKDKKILAPEKLEILIFKLEVLDYKARERAGVITATYGAPVPALLPLDAAVEALSIKYAILESVYDYWKDKRERWQKPILRRLQPPPPVNDTNPYNVFRPREKAHKLHTRRMQRRENNVQSFEKLRQVRRNLEQAKTILEALIKREEKKREVMETEVGLQRLQMKYKNETELLEESFLFPSFPPALSNKFISSEDELMESEDIPIRPGGASRHHPSMMDIKPVIGSSAVVNHRQESRWRNTPNSWLQRLDPLEPVMAFTKPLLADKLAAAGISPPTSSSSSVGGVGGFWGRIGRGGRIIFDRWNPLSHTPLDSMYGDSMYISSSARHHRPSNQFM